MAPGLLQWLGARIQDFSSALIKYVPLGCLSFSLQILKMVWKHYTLTAKDPKQWGLKKYL